MVSEQRESCWYIYQSLSRKSYLMQMQNEKSERKHTKHTNTGYGLNDLYFKIMNEFKIMKTMNFSISFLRILFFLVLEFVVL